MPIIVPTSTLGGTMIGVEPGQRHHRHLARQFGREFTEVIGLPIRRVNGAHVPSGKILGPSHPRRDIGANRPPARNQPRVKNHRVQHLGIVEMKPVGSIDQVHVPLQQHLGDFVR